MQRLRNNHMREAERTNARANNAKEAAPAESGVAASLFHWNLRIAGMQSTRATQAIHSPEKI